MAKYVDLYATWGGSGTPSDPLRAIPPSPYKSSDFSRYIVLQERPLYIRFYFAEPATTPPPPPPPPVSGDGLIRDKDVATDAHIKEFKFDWNPITGHNHDGSLKGGARIAFGSLRNIPQILQDIIDGKVVPGGEGGITGPYVSKVNGASGEILLESGNGINIQVVPPSGDVGPKIVIAAEAGANIGTPTDGEYAGVIGLQDSDTTADAFDKVDTLLARLLPAPPANLSAVPLTIAGAYQALQAGTGNLKASVIHLPRPVVQSSAPFGDGRTGVLKALVNGQEVGNKTLTEGSDVGAYAQLSILADEDPYAGQDGKAGFHRQLRAQFTPSADLSIGGLGHTARLEHSKTGASSLTFFVDDPRTPTISGVTVSSPAVATRYVSGVPTLRTGDAISLSFTVGNAVSEFYNATRIASASSSATSSTNAPLPASPPSKAAPVAISGLQVAASNAAYAESVSVTVTAYNSKGDTATQNVNTGMRLDTKSNESNRVKSGQGRFPAYGLGAGEFGGAFNPQELLTTPGNEELQVLGGTTKYPPAVNYANNKPFAGPDYSAIEPGTYANMRWYTVRLGTVTNATSLTLDIQGATNFGTQPVVNGIALYVKIEGAQGTGWIDANAAYPGVGNPEEDGQAALVFGSSSATRKVVTMGAKVHSGTVYARIGIPAGSNKSFDSVVRI